MVVSPSQSRIWRQRRQEAIALAQARERAAQRLAPEAAALQRQSWPGLEGIWLFGSVAEGRTQSSSDIDLAVAGLPLEALLTATAELDSLAASREDPAIPIDLVRLESLPPHWQQRIRERAIEL
jgi:predicted nucleotidyltransferase